MACVDALGKNPFPINSRKLEGTKSIYRIGVADYRIVYEVKIKERQIVIYHVRHRKDVYRRI